MKKKSLLFATNLIKKITDSTKAKKYFELILEKKGKQIHKASNSSDINSVAVKHPKSASNLLKPAEQSNIITQQIKNVEKPNIFDIEPGFTEHIKTATKSSKPM